MQSRARDLQSMKNKENNRGQGMLAVGVLERSLFGGVLFVLLVWCKDFHYFSMRFKIMLNMGRRGPSAVSISRRLLMSVLLNVLVSIAAVR
jgi:hypothetical protein